MREEAATEHELSLSQGTFAKDRTSIGFFMEIVESFHEKEKKKAQKKAGQAKKRKTPEPYQQRSINELLVAATAELKKTGRRDGPDYQIYIDALEAQASMAPVSAMIADEARDKTWIPEQEKEEVEAEEQEEEEAEHEAEAEEQQKKKKRKQPKKKAVAAEKETEEEAEKPKKKRTRKVKEVLVVPKADASILSSIDKGEKEKKKDDAQEVRAHIQKDLMWPTSLYIPLDRLYTPHWMWRDRDLTQRHVEMIKNEILKQPLKFFKPPMVQPVRLA